MRKGRAVFELVLPEDVQWDPVDVVIYLEDGSSHPARAKRPLVRSRARAGSSVRLTVVHDEGEQRITRITLVSGGRRFDLSVQGS